MTGKQKNRARERRRDRRILDAGLGKKATSDILLEEAAEDAVDWLERGGARRIWTVFKMLGAIFAVIIATILIIIFGQAR
jgi:hypothetical protein